MNNPVLECQSVSKSYLDGDREIAVLKKVDLLLPAGESIAIMGSSGSGKSTLLNLLGGLDKPTDGKILIQGRLLSELNDRELSRLRNQQLGFVYQMHHLLMEFTALENTAMPLMIEGMGRNEALEKSSELLDRVGLSHRTGHRPSQLSGGERQRVAIARSLVAQPACVLMDEPTGNLDQETADGVLDLIKELQQSLATSFVVVTHDAQLASQVGSVYRLQQGSLNRAE